MNVAVVFIIALAVSAVVIAVAVAVAVAVGVAVAVAVAVAVVATVAAVTVAIFVVTAAYTAVGVVHIIGFAVGADVAVYFGDIRVVVPARHRWNVFTKAIVSVHWRRVVVGIVGMVVGGVSIVGCLVQFKVRENSLAFPAR